MHVVYAFSELGRDDLIKIGTCSVGGRNRYQEAISTNPRGVEPVAVWDGFDRAGARKAEQMALAAFRPLIPAGGTEWRLVPTRAEAVAKISALLSRLPLERLPFDAAKIASRPYDMFRELKDVYEPRGKSKRQCQRRIWMHVEAGPDGFTKFSHNTWWVAARQTKSNAKSWTYNTRKTNIDSCWEWPLNDDTQSPSHWVKHNPYMVEIWNDAYNLFNVKGPASVQCGWTDAAASDLHQFFESKGLRKRAFQNGRTPPPGTVDS